MAKKLIAVTEIRHDNEIIPAGETLDASKFDKKQLEALYDAGAVRIDDGSSNDEAAREATVQTSEENPQANDSATQSAEASSPVKATTTSSPKAAAVTKETANDKGSGK